MDSEDLSAFQQNCLAMIDGAGEKPYGLGIKQDLEEYYGGEVNHGRLYPNLDTLVEEGYLKKGELDKRTNYYQITEKGKEVVDGRIEFLANQSERVEVVDNTPVDVATPESTTAD